MHLKSRFRTKKLTSPIWFFDQFITTKNIIETTVQFESKTIKTESVIYRPIASPNQIWSHQINLNKTPVWDLPLFGLGELPLDFPSEGLFSIESAIVNVLLSSIIKQPILFKRQALFPSNSQIQKIKIEKLRTLDRIESNPSVKWRCDANQQSNINELKTFIECYGEKKFQWIEEPFPKDGPYNELEILGIPFALDESLNKRSLNDPIVLKASALILKPTLLAGLSGCMSWISFCLANKKNIILSSTYENEQSLRSYAILAKIFPESYKEIELGIDTLLMENSNLTSISFLESSIRIL